MVNPVDPIPTCSFCHKDLTQGIAFCECCGNFVCPACLAETSHKEYDSAYPIGICKGCHQLEIKKPGIILCPKCGTPIKTYRSPVPTVDVIIKYPKEASKEEGLVLIMRGREPRMWALPGGFCDYGESLEKAALREAKEETGLDIEIIRQFHTYSDPHRDPRHHSITTVFLAASKGEPVAGDDASEVRVFGRDEIPDVLAFDHRRIVDDYLRYESTGAEPDRL
jgi:8-oxo-dGTP diphosphatase